ncbi:hypothetical protein SAMN04488515_0348 [Cognatiyoonia koreensis]|uniref:Uncharacterized protein n=1 Tax=Cognatiyoonia koreensis TaxID=364200 RepID=A0A1I0N0E2_9RHOB|nr:hypothetical protein [Cognatiyoonia koreensis]SEV94550.1 hypothetical protein SAMN04488515_0348 [Cognatiyoonia koreensis]
MTTQVMAPEITDLRKVADTLFEKAAAKLKVETEHPLVQSTVSGPVAVALVKGVAGQPLRDLLKKKTPLFLVQAAYDTATKARDDVLVVVTDPGGNTASLQTVAGDVVGGAELEIIERPSVTLLPSFGCSVDDLSGTILACCSYVIDIPSVHLDGQICVRFTMPRIPLP